MAANASRGSPPARGARCRAPKRPCEVLLKRSAATHEEPSRKLSAAPRSSRSQRHSPRDWRLAAKHCRRSTSWRVRNHCSRWHSRRWLRIYPCRNRGLLASPANPINTRHGRPRTGCWSALNRRGRTPGTVRLSRPACIFVVNWLVSAAAPLVFVFAGAYVIAHLIFARIGKSPQDGLLSNYVEFDPISTVIAGLNPLRRHRWKPATPCPLDKAS